MEVKSNVEVVSYSLIVSKEEYKQIKTAISCYLQNMYKGRDREAIRNILATFDRTDAPL